MGSEEERGWRKGQGGDPEAEEIQGRVGDCGTQTKGVYEVGWAGC